MAAVPASPQPGQPAASSPTTAGPVAAAPVAAPASPAAAKPTASPSAACQYGPSRRLADAQDRAIKEASALVASQRWPGVYWTLNDSGNAPSVYAIDEKGNNRGTFRIDGAENEDWEAMQVGPGKDGSPALYIGDIGDNNRKRKEITVYRVPEPEPFAVGAKTNNGRAGATETFTMSYPDGAHDAETLLVHPKTGETLIVTKETLGRANVYRLPKPLDSRKKMTLERVAELDMGSWGTRVDVVNDGTVAPDARRATIRTYGSVLEFDVPENATLASIWNQRPRVARMDDGVQAESVTYRPDGKALISIGEGMPAQMYELRWECG